MPSGGRRAGAGRRPGSGWQPAIRAMRTISAEERAVIVGSDRDPMQFLLGVVWNDQLDVQVRLSAAATAVQFLQPKLAATQVQTRSVVTRIEGQLDPVEAARQYQDLISDGASE